MAYTPHRARKGAPGYMVLYGDMMTLILTFFVLLVSLSSERQVGLVARGIGSFVATLRSHGLDGLLTDSEREDLYEEVRARFSLPVEGVAAEREQRASTEERRLVQANTLTRLAPHDTLAQPALAFFEPDSNALTDEARGYIDLLASTLRPEREQILVLEGHASPPDGVDDRLLAYQRARVVRDHLIDHHGYPPERVEARAAVRGVHRSGADAEAVDACLITRLERTR